MIGEHLHYISCAQRERHAVVDRAVQSTLEVLNVPAIAQRLGERAAVLTAILQDVVVPTVHHGHVQLGASVDQRAPIVAAYPDEDLFVQSRDLILNAHQRQSLQSGFGAWVAQALVERYKSDRFIEDDRQIAIMHEDEVVASVASVRSEIELEGGGVIGLQSAPLMIISAADPQSRTPNIIAHEAYHLHQIHEYPVAMPGQNDQRTYESDELEAYGVEADLVRACRAIGRYSLLTRFVDPYMLTEAEDIDAVRRSVQGRATNPFKASRRVRRILRRQGIEL